MILITDQFPLDFLKYVLMGLEECQVHVCVLICACVCGYIPALTYVYVYK